MKTFLSLFIACWLYVFYSLNAQYPKFPFQNIYHDNGKGTVLLSGDEIFHATKTGLMVFDTSGVFKRIYDESNVLPGNDIQVLCMNFREYSKGD